MDSSVVAIIPYVFLVTVLVALAVGFWQYRRARKAQQDDDHPELGEQPADEGSAAQRPPPAAPH